MATDNELVGGGLDLRNRNVAQIVALMRLTFERVALAKETMTTAPLMEFLYGNLTETLAKIGGSKLACKAGCHHCCTSWVAASAPEIIYLVNQTPRDTRERARMQVAETLSVTGRRSHAERLRMRTPCPMLDKGLCGVYMRRPLVCRTLVSYDAGVCERTYTLFTGNNSAASDFYLVIRNVYALALAGALKRAGLPAFFYEFNAAVDIPLSREDAETAWLTGEDIFAEVQQDRGSDMFADPWNRTIFEQAFERS